MNSRTTRTASRFVAGIATLAVATSLAAPAVADPSPSSTAGAAWLAADLEDGLFEYSSFPAVDGGLNLDAGFAMVQADDTEGATALRAAFEPQTDGYITGESFGDTGSTYAGPLGKLLAFVEASGGDPTSYDDKNLVTRLEAQVDEDGALFDTSIYGDSANVLGQAFAAQGLSEVGSTKAGVVTSYLLAQQCEDGHFPLAFRSDANDTCAGAPSVDVTALVLVALREQSDDPAVSTAVVKAGEFIAAAQNADGSVGGAPPTSDPNANTTGLAAWALGEACDLGAAYQAAAWTRDLQVGDEEAGTELAAEVGAIAYDQAALTRDAADGIEDSERDQYRRSTSQATNGLAYDPAASATVELAAPRDGFFKAGNRVRLDVTGINDGDAPCLVGPDTAALLSDTDPTDSARVTLPGTTGRAAYGATTGPGVSVVKLRVLAAKTLPVSVKKAKVPAGRMQKVIVRGLVKGESVTVKYLGEVVAEGVAGAKHRFTARFPVGAEPGKQKVRVKGEFGNRKGAEKFRVTQG